MFENLLPALPEFVTAEKMLALLRALVLVAIGLLAAKVVAGSLRRALARHVEPQQLQLLGRAAYYSILILFLVAALHQLGFNLGVVLGAAGVLTVAVGFASQTSASNVISGLFLLVEQPFKVGDTVQVGGTTGQVLSVDLLSVKLRTFDNTYVRVPNESLIKSEVKTLTRFPIRRIDLPVGIAYKEDLEQVRGVLLRVADENPLCLDLPKPQILLIGFGDSSVNLQFSVWTQRENFLDVKNSLLETVKRAFDEAGIEIPFPHRTLYAGSRTEPFPVRILGTESGTDSPPAAAERSA